MQMLFYIVAVLTSYTVSPESADTGIWPLDIGNEWNYEVTLQTPEGENDVRIETMEILRDTTFRDLEWFIGSRFSLIEPTDGIMMYANRDDGHHWIENVVVPEDETLLFAYPSEAGHVHHSNEAKIMVISTDTLITVPAGDFDCYHYAIPISDFDETSALHFFVSPGVGLVKMEFDTYGERKEVENATEEEEKEEEPEGWK